MFSLNMKQQTTKSGISNALKSRKAEREKDLESNNNVHSFYLDKSDIGLKDTLRP